MPYSGNGCDSLCRFCLHGFPGFPDRRHWIPAQNGRKLQQLDYIHAPLKPLHLGNVGLRFAQLVGNSLLRQPGGVPRHNEAPN